MAGFNALLFHNCASNAHTPKITLSKGDGWGKEILLWLFKQQIKLCFKQFTLHAKQFFKQFRYSGKQHFYLWQWGFGIVLISENNCLHWATKNQIFNHHFMLGVSERYPFKLYKDCHRQFLKHSKKSNTDLFGKSEFLKLRTQVIFDGKSMSVYLFVPSVLGLLLTYSAWAVATFGRFHST